MGIFSRTKDVQQADLEALLNASDDPLKTARLIINEMEDTLVEARSAAVRALARKKEIQRRIGELDEQSKDWERKAELALAKDREDLARGALAVKLRLSQEREQIVGLLPPVEAEIEKLDTDLADLRVKLAEARSRQRLLALRGESASARKQVKGALNETKTGDALDALARDVDRLDSEAEAYDLGKRKLEDQFAQLEQADAVEGELARLRGKLQQKN
ncbi:MAG: phage shock protein PspA [Nevskiaceae bacterium]|jgi:phage shock protein A|nr:MAG: phage shock protein PspA [Nevskiaceae bacterium]